MKKHGSALLCHAFRVCRLCPGSPQHCRALHSLKQPQNPHGSALLCHAFRHGSALLCHAFRVCRLCPGSPEHFRALFRLLALLSLELGTDDVITDLLRLVLALQDVAQEEPQLPELSRCALPALGAALLVLLGHLLGVPALLQHVQEGRGFAEGPRPKLGQSSRPRVRVWARAAAMERRAVIFDLGVVLKPGLQHFLSACERDWALPRGFLAAALDSGGPQSPRSRALRGHIGLTQLQEELDARCRSRLLSMGAAVPEGFSASRPFRELRERGRLDPAVLRAAAELRERGFRPCVLANSWLDDSGGRGAWAALQERLRRRLRPVLESCRIGAAKPQPGAFRRALAELGTPPEQVIVVEAQEQSVVAATGVVIVVEAQEQSVLAATGVVVVVDTQEQSVLAARALGVAAVLARDTREALRDLQEITGVQLLFGADVEAPPEPIPPEELGHGNVRIRPGVRLHFVELGQGPALCLCHGFPESWLSWRFQIEPLARAGFRVIALEMKGYGDSSAPSDISEYSQEQICKDFITFLDKLGIPQVILVGHDWGGAMAWNVALFYPERVRAVAVLNTPFRPPDPNSDVLEKLSQIPEFDYQLYFQEPGVAEAELEKDIGRTLKILIRSADPEDRLPVSLDLRSVRERGGLLVGLPEDPPESRLLPPAVLRHYVRQFQKSGFRGPLNWYRNMRENQSWALSARGRTIPVPALMVTAGKDPVLKPGLSKGMEKWIPRLQRGHIENCGHWTQMERPLELNEILLRWLRNLPREENPPANSKL
ncbi:bifunctional epoxide hydrolase 2 [Passerculus sandwichensis]